MSNNCLSVLYKHIIQVENKSVGGGGAQTYCPRLKKDGGTFPPPLAPPAFYVSEYRYIDTYTHTRGCVSEAFLP